MVVVVFSLLCSVTLLLIDSATCMLPFSLCWGCVNCIVCYKLMLIWFAMCVRITVCLMSLYVCMVAVHRA